MTRPKYKVLKPLEFLFDQEGNVIGISEVLEMSYEEALKLYPYSRRLKRLKRMAEGAVKP